MGTFSVELRHSIANGQELLLLLENLTLAAKLAKNVRFFPLSTNYDH